MEDMNFFESFRKPKKTDAEIEAEYTAAHEELKSAVGDLNKAHTEYTETAHESEQTRAHARESLEHSLKELENLNP